MINNEQLDKERRQKKKESQPDDSDCKLMLNNKIIYLVICFDKENLFDDSDNDEKKSQISEQSIPISASLRSKEEEVNNRSIVVRNIDFQSSIDEVELMFRKFGLINKVTLICDKYTGKSKG
jgi:RNA recognition motif-containing protein